MKMGLVIEKILEATKETADVLEQVFAEFNEKVCSKYSSEHRCCCNGCGETEGFFRCRTKVEKSYVKSLKKKYGFHHQEDGFYIDGKGCRLPRGLRNKICLRHVCEDWKMRSKTAGAVGVLKDEYEITVNGCDLKIRTFDLTIALSNKIQDCKNDILAGRHIDFTVRK